VDCCTIVPVPSDFEEADESKMTGSLRVRAQRLFFRPPFLRLPLTKDRATPRIE